MLIPENIVTRVKNCNRPGGPVNITGKDAEEMFCNNNNNINNKKAFKESWMEGWNDEDEATCNLSVSMKTRV
jgi:hypothetical protein